MKLINLKNITIATIAAITLLTGCSGNDGNVKKKYTEEDLGVYDTKTEKLIKLGDSRETIEKYIGKGSESSYSSSEWANVEYDNGLEISYDKGIVSTISLSPDNSSSNFDERYKLPTNIDCDSKVADFQNVYPGYKEMDYSDKIYFYKYISIIYLKNENNKYKQIPAETFKKEYDKLRQAVENPNQSEKERDEERKKAMEELDKWKYIIIGYDNYETIQGITIDSTGMNTYIPD